MPSYTIRSLVCCTLLGAFTSCQYFETQKIPQETFYEQEVAAIDWESVDRYPAFPDCISFTEKPEQKACFQNTLLAHLYQDLQEKKMELLEETNDTAWVHIRVSSQGKIHGDKVVIAGTLQEQLPEFEFWITESLKTLPASEPAYKRGIPVETQFKLPVVIRSED